MRKSRYTQSQIVRVLKEVEGGRTVVELCREYGISALPPITTGRPNTAAWRSRTPKRIEYWQIYIRGNWKANRFPGDDDASFSQKVFDISVALVESIIEPESLPHDVLRVQRRE